MKKLAKNSFLAITIIVLALVVFGGSYYGSNKLRQLRDKKRIENMYHLLSTTGKLHTERNSYTYLTKTGKERLQTDLSFDKKGLPHDTLTAYSEENLTLIPYNYEGTLELPTNPKKGQRIYFKTPFPVKVNENLVVTIYYKDRTVRYDSTNILKAEKNKKEVCYIYLGESSDSEGNLIKDIPIVENQAGQKVKFKLSNVERIYGIPTKKERLKNPNLFYSATELLKKPTFDLTIGNNQKEPDFKLFLKGYDQNDIGVKVISTKNTNYEQKIRVQLEPKEQLLEDLKNNSKDVYSLSLLYNGLVTKNQYYLTNNLSSLSNYNNGK